MRHIVFIVLLLTTTLAFAAERVSSTNRDFSSLLKSKTKFLGCIGHDYQKLDIVFTSVVQDKQNPSTYSVKGYSNTKGNKQNFHGSIAVKEIKQLDLDEMHYGMDDELKNSGIKAEGVLVGEYILAENSKEKHSGQFSGTMTLDWYIDKNGKLLYDNIEFYSDSYSNNQYTGQWIAYDSKVKKVANWGEYRIPNSGDLDMGADEFFANPKYKKQGW
jgi:hypothetical protein